MSAWDGGGGWGEQGSGEEAGSLSQSVSDSISMCPKTGSLEAFHDCPSPLRQRLKKKKNLMFLIFLCDSSH